MRACVRAVFVLVANLEGTPIHPSIHLSIHSKILSVFSFIMMDSNRLFQSFINIDALNSSESSTIFRIIFPLGPPP